MDLKENIFKERTIDKHYITEYISRNYEPSTKEQKEEILNIIHKTYSKKQDLDCILYNLGSAISGVSKKDQSTLFLLGNGSSGKSMIMTLTKECIECYFQELESNTFSYGYTKIDKILNTFSKNPQIRISWINEMKDTKMDESLFKSFCERQFTNY